MSSKPKMTSLHTARRFARNRVQMFSAIGCYKITLWSGSKQIKTYEVIDDRLYPEPDINGWSFFVKDKIVYVSGTLTIEEV